MGGIVQDTLAAVGIGESQAAETLQAQRELQNQIIERLDEIGIPPIEAQRIILEEPQLVGELVPELEGMAEQLGPSAFEDIEVSPELQQAQMKALSTLQERVDEGGLTAADEAELNEIFRRSAGQARAQDEAVLQNLAERGVLGSGQELLMRRAGAQEARQRAAREAEQRAAIAQANKLAAAQALGQMAGQQRGQQFGEQSEAARAADIIQQANLQQRAGVRQRDVEKLNVAQQANLAARQRIADEATRMRNQQEAANKALIQQQFQNQLQKAGAVGGAMQNVAGSLGQQAAAQSQGFGQLLSAGATLGGAAIAASDKNLKINVTDGDNKVEEMLDNLEAYDYNYVSKMNDEERHTGVMAQDLEESELGDRFVEDTPEGKMVDYGKALPTMMAGQANLNSRMRKIERMLNMIEKDEELI